MSKNHARMDMAIVRAYSDGMEHWRSPIDLSHPVWGDYRDRLLSLGGEPFPGPGELSRLLPTGLRSRNGCLICFTAASKLPGVDYENHIYGHGEVSTRENSWHDLFNALIWCRFPALKVAMNAVHFRELDAGGEGRRGKQRDALTLFDESGIIVCSSNQTILDAMARRDWNHVFRSKAGAWEDEISLFVVGHALLEKFLRPYKAITAQALLLELDGVLMKQARADKLNALDDLVAERLLGGSMLDSPACLSPLPLMGIPGWWPGGVQDDAFYDDRTVFRPLAEGGRIAPVHFC
ncbi:DUF3025 domain-containing protein [Pseudomonadota bacterium]